MKLLYTDAGQFADKETYGDSIPGLFLVKLVYGVLHRHCNLPERLFIVNTEINFTAHL